MGTVPLWEGGRTGFGKLRQVQEWRRRALVLGKTALKRKGRVLDATACEAGRDLWLSEDGVKCKDRLQVLLVGGG